MNARYYHSSIGRFMSQDPLQWRLEELMNKFAANPQAMNFYSSTANNPIAYVDPDGQEMIISDAYGTDFVTAVYQVINELHPGTGLLKIDGGYKVVINGDQKVDDGNGISSDLLGAVVDSKEVATIHKTDGKVVTYEITQKGADEGLGEKGEIRIEFNPTDTTQVQVTNGDGMISFEQSPIEITLGHELIHTEHIMKGTEYKGSDKNRHKEELRAVGLKHVRWNDTTENMLREERGYKARTEY